MEGVSEASYQRVAHGVIDCYFGSQKGQQLVKHQLDSYNDFIARKLEQIIDGFNTVDMYNTYLPDHQCYRYILSISVQNPVLSKPMIFEKDGSTKVMLPNDARLRNLTYAAPLTVDIVITAKTFIPETGAYSTDVKKIASVSLGRIPVMVRSRYCMLSQQQVPSGADECRYDYGGYFIINGNEKVVVSQDRIAENRTYVFSNTKASSYSYMAEIRSVQEARFGVPKVTSLKMTSKANQFGHCIRVSLHHIKADVPLFVVFRALGVVSDRAIVRHVIYDEADPAMAPIVRELAGCMDEASDVMTTDDALAYLLHHMHSHSQFGAAGKDGGAAHRLTVLRNILRKDFLPHVGPDLHKKALYLGYMACKLIRCFLGISPLDDRDSYINKRLDTPGVLLANLFRQYYGKVVKDMRTLVQKDINSGSWRATNKFINVINKTNVYKIIKQTVIESGLKYGLATGNWGVKTSRVRQGVAQVLNRMTYMATMSHLRRVNTPIEKTGKLVQPRKLHCTQMGIICPAETPEGASVGLVKNLALLTNITIATPSDAARMAVSDLGLVPFTSADDVGIFAGGTTKVFVNGDLIGVHREPDVLFREVKLLKRTGSLSVFTSVTWNVLTHEISICTEGGRFVRPLLVVDNSLASSGLENRLRLTPQLAQRLSARSVAWHDLVLGGVMEYLDVDEVNTSMVAMTYGDLTGSGSSESRVMTPRYTHMEIDPCTMLGVVAGSIPFSDHNQAPRNTYQSAMGKQAIGIYATTFRHRFDTMAHVLSYPQKPLVSTHTARVLNCDQLPCGMNVVVAIACFTGFNQEDSVILNKSAVDRGLFVSTSYKTFREQNTKNHSTGEEEFFCRPDPLTTRNMKPFNYGKLQPCGFVNEGSFVESGDVIIGKCMPQKQGMAIVNKDTSVSLKSNERGFIDKNCYGDRYFTNVTGDGYSFAKVRLRNERVPTIGDKVSCYSPDHEVLTSEGWVPVAEVTHGHCIATLVEVQSSDGSQTELVYQHPAEIQAYDHDGPMYAVGTDEVDLLVTLDHRMYVAEVDHGAGRREFGVQRAEDLISTVRRYKNNVDLFEPDRRAAGGVERVQLVGSTWHFQVPAFGIDVALDPWLTVFGAWVAGFFVCSGHLSHALAALGILKGRIADFLPHMLDSKNGLPPWVWALDRDQCRTLVDGILLGARTRAYETPSVRLAGDFQRLCLHAGLSALQESVVHGDIARTYRLSVMKNNEPRVARDKVVVNWTGRVHCVTVPEGPGVIYVRRNGRPVWCGNSRHGQKGTIGMLYREADMPFTVSGIIPSLIMNPHAIPSRMTVGQLMEAIQSKSCAHLGTIGDASPFNGRTVEDVARELEAAGMERYGNEVMMNPRTGEQVPCEIFIAPVHYQKLKHMVDDKVHSRAANGPVVLLTRQPAEGRARDGGLRLGEMELECLWAHGTLYFLKERFMECSDNYRVFVCKQCGIMAQVNPERGIYVCKACKNIVNFAEVRVPFASKLLLQEIQTMAIGARFVTA
jgi:DNA-directed RNA polymerase II subunit RPB2